MESNRTTLS